MILRKQFVALTFRHATYSKTKDYLHYMGYHAFILVMQLQMLQSSLVPNPVAD